MARTAVPVTSFTRAGGAVPAPVTGDTANGHSIVNDGNTGVVVTNTGSTSHTVTINLFRTVDGQAVTPRIVSISAGETRAFGPFSTADYGNSLQIDVNHAEITLRAYKM